MKIKTQNDVHLLDEKIKKDLGIDFVQGYFIGKPQKSLLLAPITTS